MQDALFPEQYVNTSPVLDDVYIILNKLGFGQYATVYLAQNKLNKQYYAIKVMKAEKVTSKEVLDVFLNEVETLSNLQEQATIKIMKISINGTIRKSNGKTFKVIYFVMELLRNELYQMIELTSPFSESTAKYLFQQLLNILQILHDKHQLFHCDIKPENIFVTEDFQVKLIDFGFAKKENSNNLRYSSSIPIGSPQYNPPEVFYSEKFYSLDQIDLFALGITLFMMVFQSCPFTEATYQNEHYMMLVRSALEKNNDYWNIFSYRKTSRSLKGKQQEIIQLKNCYGMKRVKDYLLNKFKCMLDSKKVSFQQKNKIYIIEQLLTPQIQNELQEKFESIKQYNESQLNRRIESQFRKQQCQKQFCRQNIDDLKQTQSISYLTRKTKLFLQKKIDLLNQLIGNDELFDQDGKGDEKLCLLRYSSSSQDRHIQKIDLIDVFPIKKSKSLNLKEKQ